MLSKVVIGCQEKTRKGFWGFTLSSIEDEKPNDSGTNLWHSCLPFWTIPWEHWLIW